MPEEPRVSEGILNQFKHAMVESIPKDLQEKCESLKIDVVKSVSDIVDASLAKSARIDSVFYEQSHIPDADDAKKVQKKRKYNLDKLTEILTAEHKTVIEGGTVTNAGSPYNSSALLVLETTRKCSKAEAITSVAETIDEYILKASKLHPLKTGVEMFVGLTEYPYFSLLMENDRSRAKKIAQSDLGEYVFRLSYESKFKDFAYYSPDSTTKAFYSEASKSKVEDAEYALVSNNHLKETFFPDEPNIAKVSIEAQKSWDVKDMELFSYLCTKCVSQRFGAGEVLTVEGNLNEICKVLFPTSTSPSTRTYQNAKKRLENMISTRLVANSEDGKTIVQNVFEKSVVTYKDAKDESANRGGKDSALYRIEFGRNITADILSHRLSTVIRSRLEELENPVSRFLYVQMKKDRTVDLFLMNEKKLHEYTLISLMLIFKIKENRKKARIERYAQALQEMKEKNLLIKDFQEVNGTFEVEWIPLSNDEREDIKILRQGEAQEVIAMQS